MMTAIYPYSTRSFAKSGWRIAALLAALVVALACGGANAALKVAGVFGNGVVLQRDAQVPVWGWASAGQEVTVTFAGQTKTSTADANGKWRVNLDAMAANAAGQTMTVSGDGGGFSFTNVLVGEVWVISGQSNMGWTLQDSDGGAAAAARANYPWLRYFTQPFIFSGDDPIIDPYRDGPEPDVQPGCQWTVASPDEVKVWSAVGFFFAEALHSATGVPVGLMRACQGSTYGESWMSKATQQSDPNLAYIPAAFPRAGELWYATPHIMYHVYIAPLQPFAIRGAIWYQGEANTQINLLAEHYRDLLNALIGNWRSDWGQGDFPFLIVQLPKYDSGDPWHSWPLLREAQLQAWQDTSNTGLAITIDTGSTSIHPTNKQPVGDRLARLARAMVHGEQIESTGPIYSSYTAGFSSITLHFDHVGTGLQAVGGDLRTFEAAGSDEVFHPAVATITGTDSILVSCSTVSRPLHVRYAWAWAPNCNLVNSEMLPASPFRVAVDPHAYDSQPSLIGQWTFDGYGGSDAASNKASGASWSKLALAGTGACYFSGRLLLPRYESGGSWQQSTATAMLQTDLGEGKYFRETTQIAWVKWSGFDTTADWARLTSLTKFSGSTYQLADAKAAQGMAMKATDNTNWASSRGWEYLDGGALAIGSGWSANGGGDPPIDKVIKIAQVVKVADADNYRVLSYWDLGDGLVQIGSAAIVPAAGVNAFGQSGSECLVEGAPAGNPRHDGFGIMDYCWNVPQSAGQIEFEEVRVYAGAIDATDIAALQYTPLPSARLIGHWTFDEYGGTHELESKVPGVKWSNVGLGAVATTGASVADGKLILPRYLSGTWRQSTGNCMLKTDLGATGYFREMTLIAWLWWPGFSATADWARVTNVIKCATQAYATGQARAQQGTTMKATDDSNWGGHRMWEYLDAGVLKTAAASWLPCGGLDPPTDRWIKLSAVLKQVDDDTFEQSIYWDTGSGVTQVGSARTIAASQVNAFGQYNTDCLIDPSGGKRYDGLGLMDLCYGVPQYAGQIVFDEVRLYANLAMTPAEIAAVSPVRAARGYMVGHWTFDNYLGTSPYSNKAPGITWNPLTLVGSGAKIQDGKLVLPRYLSETWKQSSAYTNLKTDLGTDGYFRAMTLVAWIKWPGFNTTSVWQRVFNVLKSTQQAYDPANQAVGRAGQSIVMKATDDNWNWGAHRVYESDVTPYWTAFWMKNGGSDPPTDRYIKIAQVLRYLEPTKYEQAMYWDIGDGNGLVPIGTPYQLTYITWVNAFGQYGTQSIPYPGAGSRYDAVGFMDFAWLVPQSPGEIIFEEARLYRGALTQADIAALKYVGEELAKAVVGASGRSLADPLMDSADGKYEWVLWGTAMFIDNDSFSIDDGSGVDVTVVSPRHDVHTGDLVSVQGDLDVDTTPPTLEANSVVRHE